MVGAPRILAFAGSLRKDSFNRKLLDIAVAGAREAGATVTVVDLGHYSMPIFDQDLEASGGTPETARKLKQVFLEHDGLLIASPEYNSSCTPLLKNTFDWVSRSASGELPLAAFAGKTAALIAASPGVLGGLRGLVHVRAILGNIQVLVLPDQIAVPAAHEAFNPDGSLKDAGRQATTKAIGRKLVETTARLHA